MNHLADYGSDSESEEEIGPPVPDYLKHCLEVSNKYKHCDSEVKTEERVSPVEEDSKRSEEESDTGPPVPEYLKQEESDIGPEVPSHLEASEDLEEGDVDRIKLSDGDTESEDEKDSVSSILDRSVELVHGRKAVSCIGVDPAGARIVTGSIDYVVNMWDMPGMDGSRRAFRTLQPCGNYPMVQVSYSCTGDTVLCVSNSSQAKVLDRDGHEVMECTKGDQYVTDTARTRGHVASLTGGSFHPKNKINMMTSSLDCTVRLWDLNVGKNHVSIIKCRAANGLKTQPTCLTFSPCGKVTATACMDGSIQLWDNNKLYVHPLTKIPLAHTPNTHTSSIVYNYAGNVLATRGHDSLKLWDVRASKKPLFTRESLFTKYNSTNVAFSPDDRLVVTGISLDTREQTQSPNLFFIDTKNFKDVKEIRVGQSHVIQTTWHPRLRQLFVTTSEGNIHIYYNENDTRGAALSANKSDGKKKHVEVVVGQQIITPHALPMFRQDKNRSTRKRLERDRADPIKSRRPDLPIKAGQGGRLAASGSTLSSYVIRNLGLSKKIEDDQDPREAILRYAKQAQEDPYWITPAYSQTQPQPIFQQTNSNQSDNDEPAEKKLKL